MVRIEPISQEMDLLAGGRSRGQFDPGDGSDSLPGQGRAKGLESGDRIVIRQRGRSDARFGQPLGQAFGGKIAVAVERVGVEIDADGGVHVAIESLRSEDIIPGEGLSTETRKILISPPNV